MNQNYHNREEKMKLKLVAFLTLLVFAYASSGWAVVDEAMVEQLMKTNKDLMETVSNLTAKVDSLEQRVSKSETMPQSVAVTTPTGTEEGHGILLTKGGNIYMDGFVDTSFNWNFHSPGTNA